jgi:hypothetical protein
MHVYQRTTSRGLLRRRALAARLSQVSVVDHAGTDKPSGPGWVHEIKLDGFRLMVRRDAAGALLVRSLLIDGEAVACDTASTLPPLHLTH